MGAFDRNRVVLIDGNNALARYSHVYTEAVNADGLPVGGLYGLIEGLRKFLLQNQEHTSAVVVVDDGVPSWRFDLAPEYKAHRKDKRTPQEEAIHQAYKAQVPHVRKATRWLGVGFAKSPGWEGDDTLAALALRRFADRGVTIYSSDKDFIELVDGDRVRLYDGISNQWRAPNPRYLLERCLDPKESDGLDGPPGVGPVAAETLVTTYQRIHEAAIASKPLTSKAALNGLLLMIEDLAKTGAAPDATKEVKKLVKIAQKAHPYLSKLVDNWKVTNLHRVAKPCDETLRLRYSAPDRAQFKATAKAYGLFPILADFDCFWPVFERLDHAWLADLIAA